ncbi:MAG: phosphoribosylaminoimidazolesuccinocarboxamide synthase [Gammaproteobacteria bacterium]|nr:phosphoribosylaminoimidazolesuccinocarboxamide synthase [Gammaproteobacteria bacterium]
MLNSVFETQIASLPLLHRGKVRDIYEIDAQRMLIITTDRISAFDVIMPTPVAGKGVLLTQISNFWFQRSADLIPNQLLELDLESLLPDPAERAQAEGRAIIVKRLRALPIEAIVRGYLIGSGWKDYQCNGAVCGLKLPEGLQLSDQLPESIYTPSTKAAVGAHDQNVDFEHTVALLGAKRAEEVREVSLKLYRMAATYAAERGIIIADTKFEFGLDEEDNLVLIDEVLTPDSSRFWPADQYQVGISPPSFDKQFLRDYLETLDWNKEAPGPALPAEVVVQTTEKYAEVVRRLMA